MASLMSIILFTIQIHSEELFLSQKIPNMAQACPYWVKLVISNGYRPSERFIWVYHVIPPGIALLLK